MAKMRLKKRMYDSPLVQGAIWGARMGDDYAGCLFDKGSKSTS